MHLLDLTSSVSMSMNPGAEEAMPEPNPIDQRFSAPERRYRRFSVRYPVSVKFSLGNSSFELRAISNNISVGGVLLEADARIPQHCDVRFILTVRGHHVIGPTQIVGEGEVVRIEPHRSGTGFAIAVKCKRPISELRSFSPSSAS